MSNISIREATIADAEEFVELEEKVRSKIYSGTKSKEEFLEKFNNRKTYLIQKDGKTIGHISVIANENGSVTFSNFVIDPEYQGRGYARKVVELIRDKVKDALRFEAATHPDNSKAIHLYESLGFKITGRKENYCGDGEPRLILEKENK